MKGYQEERGCDRGEQTHPQAKAVSLEAGVGSEKPGLVNLGKIKMKTF